MADNNAAPITPTFGKTIRKAAAIVNQNPTPWVLVALLMVVLSIVRSALSYAVTPLSTLMEITIYAVGVVVTVMAINTVGGKSTAWRTRETTFGSMVVLLRMMIVKLVGILLILTPAAILLVPKLWFPNTMWVTMLTIIVSTLFVAAASPFITFVEYNIVAEENLFRSFAHGVALGKQHYLTILSFNLLATQLVLAVAFFTCGLGLPIMIPLVAVSYSILFHELDGAPAT